MSDDWLIRSPEPAPPQATQLDVAPPPDEVAPLPQYAQEQADEAAEVADEATPSVSPAEGTQGLAATPQDFAPLEPRAETMPNPDPPSDRVQPLSLAEEPAEPAAQLAPSAQGPRCPYCREALQDVVSGHQAEDQAAERTVACADCQTPVHARCVQIHGRCVTNGCSGRSFAFVDQVPRPQIRATRIVRGRARRRARPNQAREPRQVPECPPDWWRRDAPLLVLGLVGILSLALFGDSLAEGARQLGDLHASVTSK